MRIIICEDDSIYVSALQSSIKRWQSSNNRNGITVQTFSSAEDLYESPQYLLDTTIAFLDIHMPDGMNGYELARSIRKDNPLIIIVFITNSHEYILNGYDVNALRYIIKPFSDNQIHNVLNIAYGQYQTQHDQYFVIAEKKQHMVIPYKDISYLESQGHHLHIKLMPDTKHVLTRMRLQDAINDLKNELFIQTHRAFVVNVMYIRVLQRRQLLLADGSTIPIGTKYVNIVHQAFTKFYLGKEINQWGG